VNYVIEYLFHHYDGTEEWLMCEFGTERDGWSGEDRLSAYQRMSPNTKHRIRYT
jgi:hypothetical protein